LTFVHSFFALHVQGAQLIKDAVMQSDNSNLQIFSFNCRLHDACIFCWNLLPLLRISTCSPHTNTV